MHGQFLGLVSLSLPRLHSFTIEAPMSLNIHPGLVLGWADSRLRG